MWIEEFNFYVLRNSAPDSIIFRLNLYEVAANGMPAENILKSPIIFKTKIKEGVVHLDLRNYNISTTKDFFISLECLDDKMTKEMLAFSGSIIGPSYYKFASFGPWIKSRYEGLDFNVTVSYQKE